MWMGCWPDFWAIGITEQNQLHVSNSKIQDLFPDNCFSPCSMEVIEDDEDPVLANE